MRGGIDAEDGLVGFVGERVGGRVCGGLVVNKKEKIGKNYIEATVCFFLSS